MLEIPESIVMAGHLNACVKRKRIAEVETEHTLHSFAWYEGDPGEYHAKMKGKLFGKSQAVGGLVETELEEYRLVVGDGVNIRYYEAEAKLPPRYQMRIGFEAGDCLIYSVQMYGGMSLILPETYDNIYYLAAREKPGPLSEGFDYVYFCSLRDNLAGTVSVKAFLATEQRIPGLGNGVLQDILLEAGLHPKRKLNTLRETDFRRMYDSLIKLLRQMTESGGRDTEKDLYGNPGRYRTSLSRKTFGGPCPYCGTEIRKMAYLGGTVYFCPNCQI